MIICWGVGRVEQRVEQQDIFAWLKAFLPGRVLLWDELEWAVKEHGFAVSQKALKVVLERLEASGRVTLLPGIVSQWEKKGSPFRCVRCGEEERFLEHPCASCGGQCVTCEACLSMGRCRSCTLLVVGRTGPDDEGVAAIPSLGKLAWNGRFSPFQERAARAAVQLVRQECPERELLIHAVTGAGKTEITFPAIAEALRLGQRVGLVTPRRDVVLELAPRLGQAFPHVPVVALFGGCPDRWAMGPLMVMTSHQALRFRKAFQLLIVDEVDAFPFHHEPLLPRAVAGALSEKGRLLYLTATPPDDLIQRAERGEVAVVTIPQRHHGRPLPVPQWVHASKLRQKIQQGKSVSEVEKLVWMVRATEGRLLVFVPRVKDVPFVVRWWQRQFPDDAEQVNGTHASDPERDLKVSDFRQGKRRVLVTTTILERGVTISRCHVLVLFADAPVFDAAALVQIAGRAGRDAAFPEGEVWFLSEARTRAIWQACEQIRQMNQLARETHAPLQPHAHADALPLLPHAPGFSSANRLHTRKSSVSQSRARLFPLRLLSDGLKRIRPLIQAGSQLMYPEGERCCFCERKVYYAVDWQQGVVSRWSIPKEGTTLCVECLEEIIWLTGAGTFCRRCGRLLRGSDDETPGAGGEGMRRFCSDCQWWLREGAALCLNRSVTSYQGRLREHWREYKYGGRRSLEGLWVEMFVYGWRCHWDELGIPDEILYVPMHPSSLKERGFNQARVLASGLGEWLGKPVDDRLIRLTASVRQSQQGRQERLRALDGAFRLAQDVGRELKGKQVLLVDDIYTTGSTLEACARLLRSAGARRVVSLTLARA